VPLQWKWVKRCHTVYTRSTYAEEKIQEEKIQEKEEKLTVTMVIFLDVDLELIWCESKTIS
jgi:hypothetical protein